MSRHFALSSKVTGAIAKRLPHAKNQLSVHGSFFNQFVTDIYIQGVENYCSIVSLYSMDYKSTSNQYRLQL